MSDVYDIRYLICFLIIHLRKLHKEHFGTIYQNHNILKI